MWPLCIGKNKELTAKNAKGMRKKNKEEDRPQISHRGAAATKAGPGREGRQKTIGRIMGGRIIQTQALLAL